MTKCPTCGQPIVGLLDVNFKLDKRARVLVIGDNYIRLTNQEIIVLDMLKQAYPKVVSHQDIQHELWGHSRDGGAEAAYNAVAQLVSKLRVKLQSSGRIIQNVHGVGFRLI